MNYFERAAFVEAYLQIVAYAPREYVEGFLLKWEANEDIEYDEYYTSVVDALGVWCEAVEFANKQKEDDDEVQSND